MHHRTVMIPIYHVVILLFKKFIDLTREISVNAFSCVS